MDQQVGRYKIVGKLGKGAMGMVFLAEDPLLNRQVAMKTIDLTVEEPDHSAFLRDRLLRDARAAAALSHPHIVGVYDVLEEGDRAWLVMEYVHGETLAQRMASGALDTPSAIRILGEVAAALDYTHARGVIHRDIKPTNIMIDAHGSAKIMDFGIARLSGGRTTTPTGMVMGTVEYMAPEQVKGEPLDGRADQFALAAVAYQVLTGSTLFGPQSFTTLTYKLVHEPPPMPRVRNPNLPPGVDTVLSRALAKQPAERFVNCCGFIAALAAALGGEVPASAPTSITTAGAAPGKKWVWAGIGALVLASLALGAFVVMHRRHPVAPPVTVTSQSATPSPAAPSAVPAPAPVSTPPTTTPGAAPPSVANTAPTPAPPTPVQSAPVKSPPAQPTPADQAPPVEAPPPMEPKPNVADRSLDQARALIQKKDYVNAVVLLTRVINANPNSAQAYELRGLANQQLNLFQNAIPDYSADLRLNPTHAFALHQRGICYAQLNQDDAALLDFNRALQLRPDFTATYVTRGYLFNRRHEYNRAIVDFTHAIALAPRDANAYRGRMIARRQAGDIAGAEQDQAMFNQLRQQ